MTFTDKLLVTLIAGLLLWVIKDLTLYFVKRNRIRAALLTEVSFLITALRNTQQYLNDSFNQTVPIGKKIEYSATFTPEDFDIYKEYSPVLTSYLGERDLVRIIKFYRAIHEFEVLCAGLFADLDKWKTQERVLTQEDIQYLGRKKARILSIAEIVTCKETKQLADLPEDYKGQLDAATIVR